MYVLLICSNQLENYPSMVKTPCLKNIVIFFKLLKKCFYTLNRPITSHNKKALQKSLDMQQQALK